MDWIGVECAAASQGKRLDATVGSQATGAARGVEDSIKADVREIN